MNKNKGFIGIGLIIAIVLGIVVVGFVAYYSGWQTMPKQKTNNPENVLPNNQNQNLPIVDNSKQVNVANPTNPVVSTGCTPSSTPSIKVLSPNGGEVFTLGQTINIKWTSKCINVKEKISVNIYKKGSQLSQEGSPYGYATTNIGSYNWIIPKDIDSNQYEVNVGYILTNGNAVYDNSDGFFTINSATKNVSTILSGYVKYSGNAPFTFSYNPNLFKPDTYRSTNLSKYISIGSLNNDDCSDVSISTMSFGKNPVCTEMTDKYSKVKNYCITTIGSRTGTTYKVEASTSEVCGNPPSKEARDFVDHLASELAGQ